MRGFRSLLCGNRNRKRRALAGVWGGSGDLAAATWPGKRGQRGTSVRTLEYRGLSAKAAGAAGIGRRIVLYDTEPLRIHRNRAAGSLSLVLGDEIRLSRDRRHYSRQPSGKLFGGRPLQSGRRR